MHISYIGGNGVQTDSAVRNNGESRQGGAKLTLEQFKKVNKTEVQETAAAAAKKAAETEVFDCLFFRVV